jgi:hypothetical protein
MESSFAQYRSLSEERRAQLQLITGHIPFGTHAMVGPASYVTMLREPIDRVTSLFEYISRRPGHALHTKVAGMDLRDFVESGIHHDATNGQCRLLAGVLESCEEPLDASTLDTAWSNLKDFAAFGLTERFDESLVLYRQRLGWTRLAYAPENSLRRGLRTDSLPYSTLDAVRRRNALDVELYARACRLFDETIALLPNLERDLRALQRSNRMRVPWWRLRAKLSDIKRDRDRGMIGGKLRESASRDEGRRDTSASS